MHHRSNPLYLSWHCCYRCDFCVYAIINHPSTSSPFFIRFVHGFSLSESIFSHCFEPFCQCYVMASFFWHFELFSFYFVHFHFGNCFSNVTINANRSIACQMIRVEFQKSCCDLHNEQLRFQAKDRGNQNELNGRTHPLAAQFQRFIQ